MDGFRKLLSEIGEEQMLSNCYTFMTLSTARPTEEQRQTLEAKFEQDRRYEELRTEPNSPPSPFLYSRIEEVKPDTLMPNSCGICGASFVDHGSVACTEDLCLYERREQLREKMNDILDRAPTAIVESQQENCLQCDTCGVWEAQDNWVQCDTCDTWHKIESTEGLPEKWYCSAVSKACRAPKAAEYFWPSTRAKRFARHYYRDHMRPSHMKCLQLLAARKNLTVEQLCSTNPIDYVGKENSYLYKQLTGNYSRW